MLYLSLGTNLGNRTENIQKAISLINQQIGKVVLQATPIETRPVGFCSPHAFLNSAIAVSTSLSINEILAITQAIERQMGRMQKSINGIYHDRIIDIDILLYGDMVVNTPNLSVPHPRLPERLFVLEPLAEIAPNLCHPFYGCSVNDMLQARKRCSIVALHEADCTPTLTTNINLLLTQLSSNAVPLTHQQLTKLSKEHNADTTLFLLFESETNQLIATATLALCHLLTGTKAWIEDVVVDSKFRSKGFAHILLNHLIYEARLAKADSVNLTSRPSRVAANKLYQSMGFDLRETNVYKMALKCDK